MKPRLRLARHDIAVEAEISLVHARVIMLLSTIGAEHCLHEPAHAPVVHARLVQTIEGALQQTPRAHGVWLRLCERPEHPIRIDVMGLDARDGASRDAGGDGGDGAWPGGGGGGGGGGALSGTGGSGGEGALVIFHLAEDGTLVDVEALVMAGTSTWTCPEGVVRVKLVGCGGGGGGGGGAALLTRVRE
jgi:hypothetical protein